MSARVIVTLSQLHDVARQVREQRAHLTALQRVTALCGLQAAAFELASQVQLLERDNAGEVLADLSAWRREAEVLVEVERALLRRDLEGRR
jgi:hypothetical protein